MTKVITVKKKLSLISSINLNFRIEINVQRQFKDLLASRDMPMSGSFLTKRNEKKKKIKKLLTMLNGQNSVRFFFVPFRTSSDFTSRINRPLGTDAVK
jgi:hypothetical protein